MDPGKRSLRDKIFSRLPKAARTEPAIVVEEISNPPPPPIQQPDRNPEPEVDSDGSSSVGDHLVNLEDIDLDAQFFSQEFRSENVASIEERVRPEVLSSDSDGEGDAEERGRICEMLTQLAQFNSDAAREVVERNREVVGSVDVGMDGEEILRSIHKVEGIEVVEQKEGSDGEWELIKALNVEETKQKDVEVTITQRKTGKNGKIIDVDACLKRLLQSERRDKFLHTHQVHLLCMLGRGFYLNKLVNQAVSDCSQQIVQLLNIQQDEVPSEPDFNYLKSVCDICQKIRRVDEFSNSCRKMFSENISRDEAFVLLSITILRFLAIEARLVMYLNVISKAMVQEKPKPKPQPKAKSNPSPELPTQRYTDVALTTSEILKRKPEFAHFSQVPQLDGADDAPLEPKRPRLWKLKQSAPARVSVSSGKPKRGTTSKFFNKSKAKQTKKLVSDQQPSLSLWIEVYLTAEKCWAPVDILNNQVGLEHVMKRLPDPVVYVFGWSNDDTLQDVSGRYWWKNEMSARHQRVTEKWLRPVLHRFDRRRKVMRDLVDQLQFRQLRSRAPIPEKLSEFKNHPSYCLKRDLLKFQAIYPPDAPPLGFFHGEPIYGRECVHTLHSREVWLRHAKTIRLRESPYKVVMSKLRREPTQLELFGHWQTEEYVPPEPRDGKVPRNAYGNIEIFKECMLPRGAVHLKQPNISRICRRLNVDYAPAVVGFGIHAGGNHPVFEGIVICREFEQRVLDEYERDLVEQEQQKREKRERRIYDNWRKLIKGLLIRSRLRAKYNFDRL
ncbi:DNA repair protein complementing XP-C cells homolog [Culex quinquefasciatus]|uniref:DNA repair protein complementing XP-C cells homolog n=1 Tax=Culex quinquefasciatus TaxID=7176 RepID=UPI0018E36680|nr:DNA repair protein complementing XP-C cells homolog [Culex quinquefasciatus]